MVRKLRILIASSDYLPRVGGISTVTYELAKALNELPQVEIKLLVPSSKNCRDDLRFDRQCGFNTVRLKISPQSERAIWSFKKAIQSEFQNWSPDAVLNLMWMPCGIASWLSGLFEWNKKIPYFVMIHGVEIVESSHTLRKKIRKALSWFKKKTFQNATAHFSVSEFTRNLLSSHFKVDPQKIKVLYNGVNLRAFYPKEKSKEWMKRYHLDGKFVFLTVSRLEDYKGIDQALIGFQKVIKKYPQAVYLIVGEGVDRIRLENLVIKLGIKDHVIFTGRVENETRIEFYNLADVFMLLSREDWVTPNFEGLGLVYLEAAACGKPSIAGCSGGVPEVVLDGETGWLVPPEDQMAIEAAMIQSIEMDSLRVKFGLRARERALNDFTWGRMAKELIFEVQRHVRD